MYNFIKIQYRLGNLTDEQLVVFVPKYITAEQYKEITGREI